MNPKEIKNMIDFISKSGLAEVNIETEAFKIQVKRDSEATVVAAPAAAVAPAPAPAAAPAPAPATSAEVAPAASAEANNYVQVKSPMIGTFYRSPTPNDPVFVSVGDKINVGDKVCIVEAMKLFNEIECEVSGTIVEVLVDNATPVEYDQPLFTVDPS